MAGPKTRFSGILLLCIYECQANSEQNGEFSVSRQHNYYYCYEPGVYDKELKGQLNARIVFYNVIDYAGKIYLVE